MNFLQISQFNNEVNEYLSKEQPQLVDIENIHKVLEKFSNSYYDNPKYLDVINKVFTHSVKTNNIGTLKLLTTHPNYLKKITDINTFEGLLTYFDYKKIDKSSQQTFLFLLENLEKIYNKNSISKTSSQSQVLNKFYFSLIKSCESKDSELFYFNKFLSSFIYEKITDTDSLFALLISECNLSKNHYLLNHLLTNDTFKLNIENNLELNSLFFNQKIKEAWQSQFNFDYIHIFFNNKDYQKNINYQKVANQFSEYCTYLLHDELQPFATKIFEFLIFEKEITYIENYDPIIGTSFDIQGLFTTILNYKTIKETEEFSESTNHKNKFKL